MHSLLAFSNKLITGAFIAPTSLRFVPRGHKYSPDPGGCARVTARDGLGEALAAPFSCAVNSNKRPERGQEGNDAESG